MKPEDFFRVGIINQFGLSQGDGRVMVTKPSHHDDNYMVWWLCQDLILYSIQNLMFYVENNK